MQKPLAERVRPQTLSQIIGQQHILGEGKPLRNLLEKQKLHSLIFWGPPGVGKTTLARILASQAGLPFEQLSAINAGVKELRSVIDEAKTFGAKVLFIDEIHRFNKSQQDALLGAVENGTIILIGATTENPSFEVNAALLSRSQVYVLKSLEAEDLKKIVDTALQEDEILKQEKIIVKEYDALFYFSGGDARKLLNILELVCENLKADKTINNTLVEEIIQTYIARYDKSGEQHYDIISAFIKSIRGSDPNAAVYWMARMIKAGEDPKFIARRLLILASEDIGNANPNALLLANACFQAVTTLGYPECRITLAQCVTYLASSPKSNASYMAINDALALADKTSQLSVPLHLRNAPTKLMKNLNYGKDYQYAHHYENNFVNIEFLPAEISGTKFYEPGINARENELRKFLKERWKEKYNY
ncbi:MAG TPA: replication-associated recombination protein A [Chitinophagales bacterium]|nr:MAG: replication-associated recombination protein A [Bacteroidia bacterium]HMV14029.1 replication-associated recombination protein A [Chitinophagales bacterium]HMW12692.1 replication-associated recombination protein A [Chitinophagales bacterium]HMX60273.1 replication-associated recombination protein A [Chitinophagales bacterium]HMY23019.1 replication-associated recombination protein A [Chitinophagales bacterium]